MEKKPLFIGVCAAAALLLVYFLVLGIANSWEHAAGSFAAEWQWILPLVAGFGAQAGLFSYMRLMAKANAAPAAAFAATGSVSTASMIACCIHHIYDVVPLIGLSAAAVFASKHQAEFLMLGVLSNAAGLNMLLIMMQKHRLYRDSGRVLPLIMKANLKTALVLTIFLGASAILIKLQGGL